MKTKKLFFPFVITGVIILISVGSCKKDEDNTSDDTVPTPTTTITDIDGNVYHYVTIGTQVWLVENLKVTRYQNGDSIPNVIDETAWSGLTTGSYCDYVNVSTSSDTYGRLYNWYAINDSRNICPTGWHIPTDQEWTTLVTYLGGENSAGGKLKETGTIHWLNPNTGATNESGFTGLPAGKRNNSGSFSNLYNHAYWWSSTEYDATNAWNRDINYSHPDIYRNFNPKTTGFSVRCIKD